MADTLLLVEAPEEKAVIWTTPEDLPIAPDDVIGSLFGPWRQDEIHVVTVDAQVSKLPRKLDPFLFLRLLRHTEVMPLENPGED